MAYLAQSSSIDYGGVTGGLSSGQNQNRRGLNVYTLSEIVGVTGRTLDGKMITAQSQIPVFILSPFERENIARLNSDVLGLVLSRMNTVSSLDWSIKRKINIEDQIAEKLKAFKQVYTEYSDSANIDHLVVRRRALIEIRKELPDVKDDLSNFDMALRRWKKRLKISDQANIQSIESWVNNINAEDDFEEFKKKWVFDLMVHGAFAGYKDRINGLVENLYGLPGGTVYPLRGRYVGGATGYAQIVPGFEPKIYFDNEMFFNRYVPITSRSYGLIPLEALINKIAESMLFDKTAAERADGTKPPEKLVVFGNNNRMFGDIGNFNLDTPLPEGEQQRIETKLNEARKNAIATLSGVGTPVVSDISKADTFQQQSERQDKLKRDIGHVFGASPLEMALTGSEDTSGRATSESQERLERAKGIFPLVKIIDKTMTNKIIPFKFGSGWVLEHETGLTEAEQIALETKKLQSGRYSVNEVREASDDEPYPEEIYNRPSGNVQQGQGPGQNEMSPFFMRQV